MSTATEERTSAHDKVSVEPVSEDEALRQEAISSLKQKRRFAENAVAYVAVNGILWVIWALSDRSVDGGIRVACLGHGHLGLLPRAGRLEDVRLVASQPARPISETDVAREMERHRHDSTRGLRSRR